MVDTILEDRKILESLKKNSESDNVEKNLEYNFSRKINNKVYTL